MSPGINMHKRFLKAVIPRLECASGSPGRYIKIQIKCKEPRSQVSESVGLGCDPNIYISNKFLGVVDATGPGETLLRTTSRDD